MTLTFDLWPLTLKTFSAMLTHHQQDGDCCGSEELIFRSVIILTVFRRVGVNRCRKCCRSKELIFGSVIILTVFRRVGANGCSKCRRSKELICHILLSTDRVSFKWRFWQPRHVNQPWAVPAEGQLGATVRFSSQTPGGATVCAGQETTATTEKATRFLQCALVQFRYGTLWICCTASSSYSSAVFFLDFYRSFCSFILFRIL